MCGGVGYTHPDVGWFQLGAVAAAVGIDFKFWRLSGTEPAHGNRYIFYDYEVGGRALPSGRHGVGAPTGNGRISILCIFDNIQWVRC